MLNPLLGATKHLYNWLCPSVVGLVGPTSVGRVTHSFDDPHVAPYWPTWPCITVDENDDNGDNDDNDDNGDLLLCNIKSFSR